AHDAARAPRAVDDDLGVGTFHDTACTISDLGSAAGVVSTRNVVVQVLGRRSAVENDDVVALLDPALHGRAVDGGSGELVFDPLAQGLAAHVRARVEATTGVRPSGETVLEHPDVAVAERFEQVGSGSVGI